MGPRRAWNEKLHGNHFNVITTDDMCEVLVLRVRVVSADAAFDPEDPAVDTFMPALEAVRQALRV